MGGPNTLLMGGDLTHGKCLTQDDNKQNNWSLYSGIGLVGAMNNTNFIRYHHAGTIQEKRTNETDIIEDFGIIFSELLDKMSANDIKEVIYLRDGVDWGSHSNVMQEEVAAISKILNERGTTNIKISVICLMKRHKVRMFPDYNANEDVSVTPGTAAAMKILQRNTKYPSFYLLAHAAIGTSCPIPCRAVVLRNDHSFSAEQWADFLYSTALMDQVVTLGVSLPTPTYYAHKLCERISDYLGSIPRDDAAYGVNNLALTIKKYVSNTPIHCYL